MKDYENRCYQAGMDGFVTKPFDPVQLYNAVESAGKLDCRCCADTGRSLE